jgi:hypothetical protein
MGDDMAGTANIDNQTLRGFLRMVESEYPDEFLLDLNREDLTDVARACYDEELSRRGLAALERHARYPPKLTPKQPILPACACGSEERNLITLETAFSKPQAIDERPYNSPCPGPSK